MSQKDPVGEMRMSLTHIIKIQKNNIYIYIYLNTYDIYVFNISRCFSYFHTFIKIHQSFVPIFLWAIPIFFGRILDWSLRPFLDKPWAICPGWPVKSDLESQQMILLVVEPTHVHEKSCLLKCTSSFRQVCGVKMIKTSRWNHHLLLMVEILHHLGSMKLQR